MRDKQPKRKFLVRLTKHTEYTTLVWARDRYEAAGVAEKDFAFLAGNGDLDGLSKGVKCLGDISEDPRYAEEEAYDIASGDWSSEPPQEAER